MAQLQFTRRAARPEVAAYLAGRNWLAREAVAPTDDVASAPAATDDEDACAARGWYASSWDLRCGLEVCEDLPLEAWAGAATA